MPPLEAISKDEITQPFQLVICASSSHLQGNLYRESLNHSNYASFLGARMAPAGRLREIHVNSRLKMFASDDFNVMFSHKPAKESLCRDTCIYIILYIFTKPPLQNGRKTLIEERKCRGAETMHGTALVFNHRYQSRQASS